MTPPLPEVTELREQKRGRVAVALDGRAWRVLPTAAVVQTGIVVGSRLDRHTARELARAVRRVRALATATRSLAATDRSQEALQRRLTRAGHSAAAREDAVAVLGCAGLVDDARVAGSRAELLAGRGYGDAAIRADLRSRLFAYETAAEAVTALEPELDRVRRLLAGQTVTPRILRRLAARGFSRETLEEIGSAFAQEA